MKRKVSAFNLQVFLEILSSLSFAGVVFYLIKSKTYLNYVTPRMKPYLYLTVLVMVLWALMGFLRVLQPQYRMQTIHCFVLLLPILFLIAPHNAIRTSGSANKNTSDPPIAESTNTAQQKDIGQDFSDVLPGLNKKNKTITISNDDFGFWVSEIEFNPRKYVDYKVQLTGFVFTDSTDLKNDEFMASRLEMTCCVADLTPVGLVCKYEKTNQLKSDSWVTVEGVLYTTQYEYENQTYDCPEITVTNIKPAKEVSGYVYSY
jgi:putative membrane protein